MEPKTYTTTSGDTWDSIAYNILGGCKYTALLMQHNREFINTTIFSAGAVLTLPVITTAQMATLPPWRR